MSGDAAACACESRDCGLHLAMGVETVVRGVGRLVKWKQGSYGA